MSPLFYHPRELLDVPGREHAQRDVHRCIRKHQVLLCVAHGDLGGNARAAQTRARRLGGEGRRVDAGEARGDALGDFAEPVPLAAPEIDH